MVHQCQEKYTIGMLQDELPADLLTGLENFVKKKLETILLDYFGSKEFYTACRKPNGFLWRVIKLSRLSYHICLHLLAEVIDPLLDMCRNGDLSYVPHLSQHNIDRFQSMCQRFEQYFVKLKTAFHVIGYISKEMCVRETTREAHANTAAGQYNVKRLEGTKWKNY